MCLACIIIFNVFDHPNGVQLVISETRIYNGCRMQIMFEVFIRPFSHAGQIYFIVILNVIIYFCTVTIFFFFVLRYIFTIPIDELFFLVT